MVPVMLAFYNTDRKTVKERSIIYRSRVCINSKEHENLIGFRRHIIGPPWVLGIWGEWLFIFRELGSTGPRSAVGNVSGYRCVSDCRSRGREFDEFDPGPVPYFRAD